MSERMAGRLSAGVADRPSQPAGRLPGTPGPGLPAGAHILMAHAY